MMFEYHTQKDFWIPDSDGGYFRMSEIARFQITEECNKEDGTWYRLTGVFRGYEVEDALVGDFNTREEATGRLDEILGTK